MSTHLYVSHISEDGSMAITMDKETVSYNLLALGKWFNKEVPTFAAGKYVCLLIPEDEHNIEMMFFDFKKNPDTLQGILQSPEFDQSIKDRLASLANIAGASDQINSDDIELVLGNAPFTPL